MRSTVNKVTESAKRRDTIGRNKVCVVQAAYNTGEVLLNIQNSISSDNVEKITNVILFDKTTNNRYLLKYRIMVIDDNTCYQNQVSIENPMDTKLDEKEED